MNQPTLLTIVGLITFAVVFVIALVVWTIYKLSQGRKRKCLRLRPIPAPTPDRSYPV